MRVFAALRPASEALEHLETGLADVHFGSGTRLRWVDPAQWHVTLALRADLPEGALPEVLAELAAVAACHDPVTLQLSGAGVFSGRTLWIGVGGQTAALSALLGENLLDEQRRERRRGHLTVARVSSRAPRVPRRHCSGAPLSDPTQLLLADAVRVLSVYRGPSCRAEEVEMLSSHLGGGRSCGPHHELLASVPLGS